MKAIKPATPRRKTAEIKMLAAELASLARGGGFTIVRKLRATSLISCTSANLNGQTGIM